MADLIVKYRIPDAKVQPLADAIRANNPPVGDEDGIPIPETNMETIDRYIIARLQRVDFWARKRAISVGKDSNLVKVEP